MTLHSKRSFQVSIPKYLLYILVCLHELYNNVIVCQVLYPVGLLDFHILIFLTKKLIFLLSVLFNTLDRSTPQKFVVFWDKLLNNDLQSSKLEYEDASIERTLERNKSVHYSWTFPAITGWLHPRSASLQSILSISYKSRFQDLKMHSHAVLFKSLVTFDKRKLKRQ